MDAQGAPASQGLLAALLDTEESAPLRCLVQARAVGAAVAMPAVAAVLRERAGSGTGLHLLSNLGGPLFHHRRRSKSQHTLMLSFTKCGMTLNSFIVK